MHLEWRHIWTTICTFHRNIEESQQGSGCCWQLPREDSISFVGRGRCSSCRCHFAFYLRKYSRKTRQSLEQTKENFVEWPWVKFWSFLSSGERSSYVGWPRTVESLNLEHILVHGFQMDGVCFKTITKSRCRGITQEELEECLFLPLGSTAVYPRACWDWISWSSGPRRIGIWTKLARKGRSSSGLGFSPV